jgi:hypothetical protein
MGLIYLPERKIKANFKPDFPVELNPNHPLFPSVVSAILVNGASAIDLATGYIGQNVNSVTPTITSGGRAGSFSGSSYFAFPADNRYNITGPISIIAKTSIIPGGYQGFASKNVSDGATDNPFDFGTNNASPSALNFVRANASGYVAITSTGTIPAGNNILGVSHDGNGAVYPNLYINGINVGSSVGGSAYTGSPTGNTAPLWIGRRQDGGEQLDGTLSCIWFFNQVLTAQQHASFVSNFYQLLRPRQRALMIPVSSGGAVALDSSTTATGTGAGTLSVEIPIQSSSVAVASGSGILSQSIPMAASATATVTGTGDLQIAIPLDASAIAAVAGSASMSIAQALAGSGTATGSGSGTLSTNGQMSGSGTATGSGAGTISLSIALSASAIAQAVGSGQLSISGAMAGSGTASGSGTGNLTQTIPLVSSSLASVSGTGTMVNSVPLTSSAVVNASGMGMLGVQVGFSAQAFADAMGTGNMSLIIRLSGQAVAQAVASGALTQSGILQANPRFTINALGRNFTINAL